MCTSVKKNKHQDVNYCVAAPREKAIAMMATTSIVSWLTLFSSLASSPIEALLVQPSLSSSPAKKTILNSVDYSNVCACGGVTSVKNLRPIVSGSTLYRSATLDDLTEEDAERLLNGSAFFGESNKPLAAVIDLRNPDEIKKGKKSRTEASKAFYASSTVEFRTISILGNIDAFWEEAISTMDAGERMMATLQTVLVGGALDRAAARHLERGGLPLLYTIMMKIGGGPLASALDACLEASVNGGPVIFHCQKGKDRTGVLAMLLQTCLDNNDNDSLDREIVDAYVLSGELLGELPNQDTNSSSSSSLSSTIDWSYFRGSPAYAMEETLAWVRSWYGSVEGYMDSISFGAEKRAQLRNHCQK